MPSTSTDEFKKRKSRKRERPRASSAGAGIQRRRPLPCRGTGAEESRPKGHPGPFSAFFFPLLLFPSFLPFSVNPFSNFLPSISFFFLPFFPVWSIQFCFLSIWLFFQFVFNFLLSGSYLFRSFISFSLLSLFICVVFLI